ncbi:MAG TPA: amino acid permease [Candidatus Binataceae bacterium]|nr:amino acid permease [Candidatus Binataceae bacterium]
MGQAAAFESLRPKASLSLFDSAAIVAGSMIGSGIFIVAADIVRETGSPAGLLAVWIASGLMTMAGALAYGELAGMMPWAGGQYVFLREAYGGLPAFCFGWTLLLVIQTGTIAAVAVAFGRFAGALWPVIGSRVWFGIGAIGLSGERLVAVTVIALLTLINLRGLNLGRIVQNIFTSTKVLSLLLVIVLGCLLAPNATAIHANFGTADAFFGNRSLSTGTLATFGAAMVGGLFSSDAWAGITFAAAEVRDPERNLPRALAIGTGVVILLYLLTNFAYLCELPANTVLNAAATEGRAVIFARGIAHATSDRVASAAMEIVWGHSGAAITAILVMISTFGCANGLILTGARVIYAMGRDGSFFAAAGQLNSASIPAFALVIQGLWAALLTLSGSYSQLLDYVIFAQLLFYALTVSVVFVLRMRQPAILRPYRAWGYPWIPFFYIVAASALMTDLLIVRSAYTWPGLLIALSGAPIYLWRQRRLQLAA